MRQIITGVDEMASLDGLKASPFICSTIISPCTDTLSKEIKIFYYKNLVIQIERKMRNIKNMS
jgi:hypothetical protein